MTRKWHNERSSEDEVIIRVQDGNGDAKSDWILDSGASCHLVNDERLLLHAIECSVEVSLADEEKLVLTKVGGVRLFVTADDKESTVLLTNMYFAPSLTRNIVSYGKLDANGYALTYASGKRVVASRNDDHVVFNVVKQNSVLVVRTFGKDAKMKEPVDVIMTSNRKR